MKNKIDELIKSFINNDLHIKDNINYKIDIPKNKKFGDFSTNFSMILASKLKKNLAEIA